MSVIKSGIEVDEYGVVTLCTVYSPMYRVQTFDQGLPLIAHCDNRFDIKNYL